MNTAEILDKAADLIDARGHQKGCFEGPDGSLCALGALRIAAEVHSADAPATQIDERWNRYYSASHMLADTVSRGP